MSDFEFLINSTEFVTSIDLNRPEDGNALTRSMMEELASLIQTIGKQSNTSAIVLKARGEVFCRGRDSRGEGTYQSPYERRIKAMAPVLNVYNAIATSAVPVVALVHGPAVGFGAALAGACDVTLVSDQASFAFPEIIHSIPPTMAMAAVLRNVPPKALAFLIYSAETVSATEAVAMGLASKVFPATNFDAMSTEFITTLVERPRLILETVKKFQSLATGQRPELVSEYAGTLLALIRS